MERLPYSWSSAQESSIQVPRDGDYETSKTITNMCNQSSGVRGLMTLIKMEEILISTKCGPRLISSWVGSFRDHLAKLVGQGDLPCSLQPTINCMSESMAIFTLKVVLQVGYFT